MYEYIKGKVISFKFNSICLENNNIGYKIFTSVSNYNIGEEYKIYIFQNIKEDENTLYGFKSIEEKDLFLKLIGVKGVGCKTALPMIDVTSINDILNAIEKEDIIYLKKFPKIGDKVARQIILDLKGKLINSDTLNNTDLIDTLKSLGYKTSSINEVLPKIKSIKLEDQIKEALKLFLK